jgi:uncharacterized protein DUF5996
MPRSLDGSSATSTLPPLPLEEWEDSKQTLHRYAQIVGKIRLELSPPRNHWWQVPSYVSSRGLTTSPIPYRNTAFEIAFDFVAHELRVMSSTGGTFSFALEDGLSVAGFYSKLFSGLDALGIEVAINAKPFGLDDEETFESDTTHASYDKEYVTRFWRILVWVDSVFKEFSGRSVGKTSPVHLFWHSFDLAVTRFSGSRAPEREGADQVTREAYSHEVISFGFWAGDQNLRTPAFYSYTAPEPESLTEQPLGPEQAFWVTEEGGSIALLMYDDLRNADSPKDILLKFLESAYQAGARSAGWNLELRGVLEQSNKRP